MIERRARRRKRKGRSQRNAAAAVAPAAAVATPARVVILIDPGWLRAPPRGHSHATTDSTFQSMVLELKRRSLQESALNSRVDSMNRGLVEFQRQVADICAELPSATSWSGHFMAHCDDKCGMWWPTMVSVSHQSYEGKLHELHDDKCGRFFRY